MEVLGTILEDWQACGPDVASLPAQHADAAVDRVVVRAYSMPLVHGGAFRDVHVLLSPQIGRAHSPSPFITMLRIRAGSETSGDDRLQFLRFWQACQELWRRVQQFDKLDDEPLVEEIAALRDAVLRSSDGGCLALDWFCSEVTSAKAMSADREAWQSLERYVELLTETNSDEEADESPNPRSAVTLDEVSMALLNWLVELEHDYCRGDRFAKIQAVRHVAGCTRRIACLHLGSCDWDVEAALLSFFGGSWETTSSWSSQGAKLRRDEVECPICTLSYKESAKSVATNCCFQVLCAACHSKLTDAEGFFQCPFCRSCEMHLKPCYRQRRPLTHRALAGVFRFAGRAASRVVSDVGELLGELANISREVDGSPGVQPHGTSETPAIDESTLLGGAAEQSFAEPEDEPDSTGALPVSANSAEFGSARRGLPPVALFQAPPIFNGPRLM